MRATAITAYLENGGTIGRFRAPDLVSLYQEETMDERLAVWQIAEFILGGLDEDELEEVYRHVDECGECVILAGGRRAGRGLRE